MHATGKPRLLLWTLLSFALIGAAVLGVGFLIDASKVVLVGASMLIFATILSVATSALSTRTPAAEPVPPLAFDYPTQRSAAVAAAPEAMAHAGRIEDDLVEFELVDERQVAPQLRVPAAFEVEARVEAQPVSQPEIKTGSAVGRRKQMVSGLPLVSSIFAEEPPEALQVGVQTDKKPAGKTRGQCSSCGTLLWAPTQRPLRLRCPRCGHVRTLTE